MEHEVRERIPRKGGGKNLKPLKAEITGCEQIKLLQLAPRRVARSRLLFE